MKSLEEIFHNPEKGIAFKWPHYFKIYESYFESIRDRVLKILEIGIGEGGSLWMWNEYFPNSEIIGIDIKDKSKFEGKGVKIYQGSQSDKKFLKKVIEKEGPFDIIIDDGSHVIPDQFVSFVTLFPNVINNGLYIIEDLHTSYWKKYGAIPFKFSMIEYLKVFIDSIHHRRHDNKAFYGFSNIEFIHFYESIAVIKKGTYDITDPIKSRYV